MFCVKMDYLLYKDFKMAYRIYIIVAFAFALASLSYARPAEIGAITVQNKDGSFVSVQEFGDEHYHFVETSDGILVMRDGNGNYVYVNEDGEASAIVAKDAADRTEEESAFLNGLDQKTVHKNHKERYGGRYPQDSLLTEESSFTHMPVMAYNQEGVVAVKMRPQPEKWTVGERWFPVILVGTPQRPHGDSVAFYDFFNKPGYNVNRNIGSVRDYFLFVSDGLFDPHFDVYPVDIGVELESFGSGKSYNETSLIATALKILVKRSDFIANANKYCYRTSHVDGFFFLYPGMDEEARNISDGVFWSHMYYMSGRPATSYRVGNYYFNRYMFGPQYLNGSDNTQINKMGTFVHEFSHVLGLNDHYSKDAEGRQINGPGKYDLMSQGMYNGLSLNSGETPMGYSAFKKETVGWLTLQELEADQVYSLKKLSKMQAYSITNPDHYDEYYIVEYRPAEKYDAYVDAGFGKRSHGVYVWYIDYHDSLFTIANNANGDVSHQRVAMNAVLDAGEYYVDFTYVNKSGVALVPGIYNLVFDETRRVCFTTSQSMPLEECPEDTTLVEESSSSEASPESSSATSSSSEAESSSSTIGVLAGGRISVEGLKLRLEGHSLYVAAADAGLKKMSLFDMQGHVVTQQAFSGTDATLDLSRMPRGHYVVLVRSAGRTMKHVIAVE